MNNSRLRAILAQETNAEIIPIAYAFKSLIQTESNYLITDKKFSQPYGH